LFSDTWRIISFTCESVWIIHTKYFVTSLIKIQKKKKENLTKAKASLRSRYTQLWIIACALSFPKILAS
jgi:hypothetical protein